MAAASPFELAQIEAAQAAIDGNNQIVGLEEGADTGTDLYHMLGSLLTWSDAWGVDFDEILSQLRADAPNLTATATKFAGPYPKA